MPRTFTVCAITGNAIAALLAPRPINLLNATVAGIVVVMALAWSCPQPEP
jgi:hypothetical protein